MNFVEVFDSKISVHLPVKNDSLSIQTICAYFPHVSGLTFFNEDNKKCGLSIVNDRFELLRGVSKYEVHSSNILKEHNVSDMKRKRINEIMNIIEGKSGDKSASVENQDDQIPAKKTKKIVYVGWRHKANPQESRYIQMKKPVGGIKKIELDSNKEYTFEETKEMSIAVMKNEFNENTLKNSCIKLASSNEEVIENFKFLNGIKCKFWDIVNSKLKLKNSQLRLFLLSTGQIKEHTTKSEKPQEVSVLSVQKSIILSSKTGCRSKIHFSISQRGSSVVFLNNKDPVTSASKNKIPSESEEDIEFKVPKKTI